MKSFGEWVADVMILSKEILTEEAVAAIDEMDDKKLGGMLIQGYTDKTPPNEMAILIADAVDLL